jgi:hypothetical protein
MESDGGHEGEAGCGGVPGAETHEGARIKVAIRRVPVAALPPPAPALPVGADPQAFRRAFTGASRDIVVGGPRFRDFNNQKSDPAAVWAAASI